MHSRAISGVPAPIRGGIDLVLEGQVTRYHRTKDPPSRPTPLYQQDSRFKIPPAPPRRHVATTSDLGPSKASLTKLDFHPSRKDYMSTTRADAIKMTSQESAELSRANILAGQKQKEGSLTSDIFFTKPLPKGTRRLKLGEL
tara:strand:+ start:1061 stop:1486 length:426 start_codon:yes stop_codon:yes gene_type:complete